MKTPTYTVKLTEQERIVLINCLSKCETIAAINADIYNHDTQE